jgi:hypothetical protein
LHLAHKIGAIGSNISLQLTKLRGIREDKGVSSNGGAVTSALSIQELQDDTMKMREYKFNIKNSSVMLFRIPNGAFSNPTVGATKL